MSTHELPVPLVNTPTAIPSASSISPALSVKLAGEDAADADTLPMGLQDLLDPMETPGKTDLPVSPAIPEPPATQPHHNNHPTGASTATPDHKDPPATTEHPANPETPANPANQDLAAGKAHPDLPAHKDPPATLDNPEAMDSLELPDKFTKFPAQKAHPDSPDNLDNPETTDNPAIPAIPEAPANLEPLEMLVDPANLVATANPDTLEATANPADMDHATTALPLVPLLDIKPVNDFNHFKASKTAIYVLLPSLFRCSFLRKT